MSWQLLIVKGDREILRGFVHGFTLGIGKPNAAFCEAELPLEREFFAELLRGGPHHRVLVEASAADTLVQALAASFGELRLGLKERRTVLGLKFFAEAKTFSSQVMTTLQEKLFGSVPSGVSVLEKEEKKEEDPAARGPELYTPVHQLQYQAKVTYQGEVPAMLAWHKELAATDFVEVSPMSVL